METKKVTNVGFLATKYHVIFENEILKLSKEVSNTPDLSEDTLNVFEVHPMTHESALYAPSHPYGTRRQTNLKNKALAISNHTSSEIATDGVLITITLQKQVRTRTPLEDPKKISPQNEGKSPSSGESIGPQILFGSIENVGLTSPTKGICGAKNATLQPTEANNSQSNSNSVWKIS
ncbi:hypothetical protein ACFE04_020900 [Oxalis oulophora]